MLSLAQVGDWIVGTQRPSSPLSRCSLGFSTGAFAMVMDGPWLGKGVGEQKRGQKVMAKSPWATLQGYMDTPQGDNIVSSHLLQAS